jgi:argininosuccinate lyase
MNGNHNARKQDPHEQTVREASRTIAAIYAQTVLDVNFIDMKQMFHRFLIDIHYAHSLMLRKQGILNQADAVICLSALGTLENADLSGASFHSDCEDYFFFIEQQLGQIADPSVVGKIHTARSRNDIDLTLYRMKMREALVSFTEALIELWQTLLSLAHANVKTLMPAHTHGQPAQPTTLAHYILAFAECVERDVIRCRSAFTTVNKSPMGACAITTTAFPIDREYVAKLLGFDGLQLNSYGAIASVDYLSESMAAVMTSMLDLGRFVQDLLTMCSRESGTLRLNDGFVQISSIMPQKRNPSSLEHCRALSSNALMEAQAVIGSLHNTPFADMVDGEDDLQPLVSQSLVDAIRAVSLLNGVLNNCEFDEAALRKNAGRHFITVTELADTLVREGRLSFQEAHRIVSEAVTAVADEPSPEGLISEVMLRMQQLTGETIGISGQQLLEALDPQHFVEVRNQPGGPSESAVAAQLSLSEVELDNGRVWSRSKRAVIATFASNLRSQAATTIKNDIVLDSSRA